MMDPLPLAEKVRKARRTGRCTICHGPVFVGQPIARLPKPPGWCHIRCAPSVAAVAIRSHEEQEDAQ